MWIHRFINIQKNGKSIKELHYLKFNEKYANLSFKILMRRKYVNFSTEDEVF